MVIEDKIEDKIETRLSKIGKKYYQQLLKIINHGLTYLNEKNKDYKDLCRYFSILLRLCIVSDKIKDDNKFNKLFIKYYSSFEKKYKKCKEDANLFLSEEKYFSNDKM